MPAGTKHYEVAADIVEAVGDQLFDDRGLAAAAERLSKPGRLFGRKELRHLGNLLRHSEHVVELGQGQYEGKQGGLFTDGPEAINLRMSISAFRTGGQPVS